MRINCLFLVCLLALSLSVPAQSRDEKLVAESVEKLRKAMIDPDRTTLDKIASVKLSYGHSSGKIEDKAAFIEALVSGQSDFITIKLSDQTIVVSGNTAIVRHVLEGDTKDSGKPNKVKIAVLLVWNQKGAGWQLLARQAVKLAQ